MELFECLKASIRKKAREELVRKVFFIDLKFQLWSIAKILATFFLAFITLLGIFRRKF
jgi:hypothetical protein